MERGEDAWEEYLALEQRAKEEVEPGCRGEMRGSSRQVGIGHLQPAWNWLKWGIIVATELGAFLASLKEIMEPQSGRRVFQRVM